MDDEFDRARQVRSGRSPYLNTAQAGHYLGLSVTTLKKLRKVGGGPRFRRHSRLVQYHVDDLRNWSDAQSRDIQS